MLASGVNLRTLRERLGLTMRDVEIASTRIAERRRSDEFVVNPSRLSDIENKGLVPSIYRLYSLAVIYRRDLGEILSYYGLDLKAMGVTVTGFSPIIEPHISTCTPPIRFASTPREREVSVPLAASYLLDLFLPKKHREGLVGDLEEEFRTKIEPRYGRKAACFWFWKQVISEVGPGLYLRMVTNLVRRMIGS
jgi:transcriptional regulator with XRE-family HTH domain